MADLRFEHHSHVAAVPILAKIDCVDDAGKPDCPIGIAVAARTMDDLLCCLLHTERHLHRRPIIMTGPPSARMTVLTENPKLRARYPASSKRRTLVFLNEVTGES